MHIVIIIPTFNERENIAALIPALLKQFERILHQMSVLVVDDSSPDGTADVVKEFATRFDNIHIISGKKEGLGIAYTRGMKHALNILSADAIMEMDADFSHKPLDVPRLIAELDNYDFVIGSRYIKGGSVPEIWGLFRKLNSRIGNIFARYIAGIYSVRDCTAGFRAIRAAILSKINLNSLTARGYCFQISLLHKALYVDARVKEIPVEFVDRTSGESKLGISDIIEFLTTVWAIRLHSSRTFIKFALVGLFGVAVNLGLFTILISYGINKYIASPISTEISIISNFMLNHRWTFGGTAVTDIAALKGLKFNLLSLAALCVSYAIFVLVVIVFPSIKPQIAQLAGIIPAILINYLMNFYWTVNTKKRTTVNQKS